MWRPNRNPSGPVGDSISPDILERCRNGDEGAWKELVEATYRDVYSLCLRILGDPDDASEATQDAYLKAWRGLKSFRGDSLFSTWLYRVATNAALSKHRSRKRRRSHEAGAEDEVLAQIPSAASTENAAGAKVELVALDQALSQLPEHYRSAVVLKDVYGLTIEEIAKELKCSETAAKVRIHRGRKRLKDIVYGETP
ncbi:MAG: RNA polymerase sigma factor [Actinomycetota bacterium]